MSADEHAGKRAPELSKTHQRRRATANALTMRRAAWAIKEYKRSPTTSTPEMLEMICEEWGCGINAAQNAHARALDVMRTAFAELDLAWFADQYKDLLERARADKKWNAARLILDSMAVNTGFAAPRRVHLDVPIHGISPEKLAHVSVLALTPAQRDNRERELAAKEAAAARAELDLEADMPVIDAESTERPAAAESELDDDE